MSKMTFRLRKALESDHCYLGSCPTVDTTLIPLCHTWFLKKNRMHNYMYDRIKFHTYSDVIME